MYYNLENHRPLIKSVFVVHTNLFLQLSCKGLEIFMQNNSLVALCFEYLHFFNNFKGYKYLSIIKQLFPTFSNFKNINYGKK